MKENFKRWASGMLVPTLSCFGFMFFFGIIFSDPPRLLPTMVLTAVFTFGFNYWVSRYEKRLTTRMEADRPTMWNIFINGIKVGAVSDSQYAAMQRSALRDGRLVLAQFLSMCHFGLIFVLKQLLAVSVALFGVAAGLVLVCLKPITEIVPGVTEPATITSAVFFFLRVEFILLFLLGLSKLIICGCFRFRDYDEAVARMLRQHSNTAVIGGVSLIDSGSPQKIKFIS
ncbi:MAG: hypothetical protein LBV49_04165 [Azonexus sp.]|jgi:hypothetical protein|nr:hypothetical protein [Azonexus sp.]